MQALMYAVPSLGAIGLGVALVGLFARDPQDADEHTVADYRPTLAPARRDWPLVDREAGPRQLRPVASVVARDILPPAPPGTSARLAFFAEQVVAEQMRKQYGTTDHAVIAGRMLREIADDELAKAGIGPDGHAWQPDGSCWSDCPACARDLTGAFPVVSAA